MISIWLLCAAFLIFVSWMLCMGIKKVEPFEDAPGASLWLRTIGSINLFLCDTVKLWELSKMLVKDTSQKGGVTRFRILRNTYYGITDPDDAATVANACLERHYVYQFGECCFGQSLLTAPVSIWKSHRKFLRPAFNLPMIHGFMEIFNEQAQILVDEMNILAKNVPFEATPYIHSRFLKTTCLTAYGGNNLHNEETFSKYTHSFDEIENLSIQRFQKFWLLNDFIFNLSGLKKKQLILAKTMTDISDAIIQNELETTIQQRSSSNVDNRLTGVRTYLDMFLQLNENNDLTTKELRDELNFTIAASFDTTSVQFEYILYYLGSYSTVQELLYKEIITVIGLKNKVSKEDLQKLVYTEAVIKETLRLQPVVPFILRTAHENVKLKNCVLRGGSHALIMLYGINRDPSWGPDADQFRPERWLEPGGVPSNRSGFASFSIGKRDCLGKTHALIQLKVTLAHFVRKYQIKADITKIQFKLDVLCKPAKGNEISLKSRNTS